MEKQKRVRTCPGLKTMKFKNQKLRQFTRKDQFTYEQRKVLDSIQLCIIDNIWNIPTPLVHSSHRTFRIMNFKR